MILIPAIPAPLKMSQAAICDCGKVTLHAWLHRDSNAFNFFRKYLKYSITLHQNTPPLIVYQRLQCQISAIQ